ncbi:MAG: Murein DD-endopeptidase MepS/Murein LD-carboxypeptidase [Sodalis sp.]|nr:MAG: Murein DD-endopeptidase MepS/Murein LD-carboxypeptidase [Sodalis sp.]
MNLKKWLVDIKFKMMDQYADWKGVRHCLGDSTERDIDYSGFV